MDRRSLLALVVPLALAWIVTLALSFSSQLEFMFVITMGIPLAVMAPLTSTILVAVSVNARIRGRDAASVRWMPALALSLVLAVLTFLPVLRLSASVVRELRRPARELLAERVIERARSRRLEGRHEVPLENARALLSDGGTIDVYVDGSGASVWFWDFHGILDSYAASIYVAEPNASAPPGRWIMDEKVHQESAHWWRSLPVE